MSSLFTADQKAFYERFLMSRSHQYQPRDYGVEMEKSEFMDLMVDEFNAAYHGIWTVDELLLHPREAIRFCDDVRHHKKFFDVPDDIILRAIMQRRKNP